AVKVGGLKAAPPVPAPAGARSGAGAGTVAAAGPLATGALAAVPLVVAPLAPIPPAAVSLATVPVPAPRAAVGGGWVTPGAGPASAVEVLGDAPDARVEARGLAGPGEEEGAGRAADDLSAVAIVWAAAAWLRASARALCRIWC